MSQGGDSSADRPDVGASSAEVDLSEYCSAESGEPWFEGFLQMGALWTITPADVGRAVPEREEGIASGPGGVVVEIGAALNGPIETRRQAPDRSYDATADLLGHGLWLTPSFAARLNEWVEYDELVVFSTGADRHTPMAGGVFGIDRDGGLTDLQACDGSRVVRALEAYAPNEVPLDALKRIWLSDDQDDFAELLYGVFDEPLLRPATITGQELREPAPVPNTAGARNADTPVFGDSLVQATVSGP